MDRRRVHVRSRRGGERLRLSVAVDGNGGPPMECAVEHSLRDDIARGAALGTARAYGSEWRRGRSLKGISDQGLSALYRVHEQGPWMPALAFSYAIKIPTANPSKGFGTGYTDHQLIFIASRDLGRVHVDFNAVGTIAGGPDGHDGATQFGLALSLPVTSRFTWVLDSFGGAQPGTTDKYGAALSGGTWALRPWLVLDGAYTRAYTAGAPRQQFTFGVTHAIKPGFGSALRGARVARLFGR